LSILFFSFLIFFIQTIVLPIFSDMIFMFYMSRISRRPSQRQTNSVEMILKCIPLWYRNDMLVQDSNTL
jgi:hypothetical protein